MTRATPGNEWHVCEHIAVNLGGTIGLGWVHVLGNDNKPRVFSRNDAYRYIRESEGPTPALGRFRMRRIAEATP